jgi:predicted Co/Zn/Cd cation transporter (cation efflux family)|tara:strand:- start:7431 stop:7745 length:315 start_codon:yes stop_codon:yes gene_type:complete
MINKIKTAFAYMIPILLTLLICYFIGMPFREMKSRKLKDLEFENKKLKKEIIDLEREMVFLSNDYDRIYEENQVFTSIMGAIENEPGGHEILKTLWGEYGNEEE